ncbi:MAG: peptidoglycan-binding domain-containing protein [Geminicoccaceae bacterium]
MKKSLGSILIALAGFSCLSWALTANAADSEGRYAVKGAGGIVCKQLADVVAKKDERTLLLLGWLEGYITAANRHTDKLFDATPWQRVELLAELLTVHCQNRPDQPVYVAVELMLGAMKSTSLKTQSPVETVDIGDGKKLEIYREIMRMAQQRLIDLGHLTGTADGKYGPKTASGFKSFQKSIGLDTNGLPDQATLLNLFRGLFGS